MRKTYIFIIAVAIATMGALVACYENIIIDETYSTDENKSIIVEGNLNLPSEDVSLYDDCNILSITDIANIDNGTFEVGAYSNNQAQTFYVQNNDEIYLMSRAPISDGEQIDFSIQSTAIAMVTMHPLFSPVGREDYATLTDLITNLM